jgi:DNA-binding response OmpR family regulator
VLVIDDEEPIRLLCRVNLEAHDFEVVEAKDGAEGLEVAERERPDLILLGVMMPRLDGWQVAEHLQKNRETRSIPIVFLTARSRPSDRLRGMELGAVDYLTKPFNPAELPVYVERLLGRLALGRGEQIRREGLRKIRELLESREDELNDW